MILFREEFVAPILAGTKTQTRRIWPRCRVRVGGTYACSVGRFSKPFARVRVVAVHQEPLSKLSDDDVKREGYQDRDAFLRAFESIYGTLPLDVIVTVIDFEVVT